MYCSRPSFGGIDVTDRHCACNKSCGGALSINKNHVVHLRRNEGNEGNEKQTLEGSPKGDAEFWGGVFRHTTHHRLSCGSRLNKNIKH